MQGTEGSQLLTSLIAQAGISGVFIFFFWRLYTDTNKKIDEKDNSLKELNDKVLEAFKQNTASQMQLSESIKQNTEANKTLSERVYDVIKSGNGNGNRK